MKRLGMLLAAAVLSAAPLSAQLPPDLDQGLRPYGAYQHGEIDSVSLTTGNVNLHIPLFSLPQRGGKLTFDFGVVYNNKGWQQITTGTTHYWQFAGGGVGVVDSQGAGIKSSIIKTKDLNGDQVWFHHYGVLTPDGSYHEGGITSDNSGGLSAASGETIDGSGFYFDPNNGVIDRNGVRYGYGVARKDPNGNQITFTSTSSSTGYWTDTLGRTVPNVILNIGVFIVSVPGVSSSTTNCPSGTVAASELDLSAYNGSTAIYKFCYAYFNYQTAFNSPPYSEASGTFPMMNAIVLPNLTKWLFNYNSYLDLTSITFPTGGTITYTWATSGFDTISRVLTQRTLNANDGTGPHTSNYQYKVTANWVNVLTDPAGNDIVTSPCLDWGYVCKTQYYSGSYTSGTLLKTVSTTFNSVVNPYDSWTGQNGYVNVVPTNETTAWPSGKTRQATTNYDPGFTYYVYDPYTDSGDRYTAYYGTPTLQTFSDYGQGSAGPILKQNSTAYKWQSDSNYLTANILSLPATSRILDVNNNVCAETDYAYDDPSRLVTSGITMQHVAAPGAVRGNISSITRQLTTTPCQSGASWTPVPSYINVYDTGMPYQAIDPLSHTTTYTYSSAFYGAYPTQTQLPDTGSPAVHHITSTNYDFNTGLITSTTDQNNNTTNLTYDSMSRLTQSSLPDSGLLTFSYQDSSPFGVTVTRKLTSTLNRISKGIVDGVGRLSQSQLTTDPNCTTGSAIVKTDFVYTEDTVAHDRLTKASTPYCDSPGTTFGLLAVTHSDPLGRVKSIVQTDNSTVTTTYTDNLTTVTDEAGKARKTQTDGLGRLTAVWEDPAGLNYETDYTYDPLGNLLTVNQKGGTTDSSQWRTRTFAYDSLSRLTSSTNPESNIAPSNGAIVPTTYAYDADGNLYTKTAPAANQQGTATTTTTYTYDALNRLASKTYSDGTTPTAVFTYDIASRYGITFQNPIGRMVLAERPCSTVSFSYDPVGRVISNLQDTYLSCTGGAKVATLNYQYDLAGDLISLTNAAGVTFTQTFDGAARATSLTSSLDDAQHPPTLATADPSMGYYPSGALRKLIYGNGLTATWAYNNRLQPCRYNTNSSGTALSACTDSIPSGNLQDFNYGFNAGSSDNGNIAAWSATGQQAFTRSFRYDSLNRIASMSQTAGTANGCGSVFGLSWNIDSWGNRTDQNLTSGTCNAFHQAVDTNNRLLGSPYTYDAAGNMTFDGNYHYTYDAENRLIQVDSTSGSCSSQSNTAVAAACYVYDALGRRSVKIPSSGVWTQYFYDLSDNVDSEFGEGCGPTCWVRGYVYFNGQQIAEYGNSTTYFLHKDHLGSTRLLTGVGQNQIVDSMDYLPFGEQIAGGSATTHKFTGKERDSESNLDNFGARYNSSSLGRFMHPDPLYMELHRLVDPQQHNLYAYARNNPLKFTDPTGLYITCTGDRCEDYLKALQKLFGDKAKLAYDKSGQVTVDGKVAELKGGLKELMNAIDDKDHHVTINAVGGKEDSSVFFGASHGSTHTINFDQAALLDNPKNAGGMTSAQLAGHETLEGYAESMGATEEDGHKWAGSLGFPGFDQGGKVTGLYGNRQTDMVYGYIQPYRIQGTNTIENISINFVTPIPNASLHPPVTKTPGYPVGVEKAQ